MSTLSSRSALNLQARLEDLENDEKLMDEERQNNIEMDNDVGLHMFSNESTSSSVSNESTISSKSASNLENRLNEFEPSKTVEKTESPKGSCNSEVIFKQPTSPVRLESSPSILKISSVVSLATTISSCTGLAERLDDFESHTIEESFKPMEIEKKQIFPTISSFNSIQSTMSSKSAQNLQTRLHDFDNEPTNYTNILPDTTISRETSFIQAEHETTLQESEIAVKESDIQRSKFLSDGKFVLVMMFQLCVLNHIFVSFQIIIQITDQSVKAAISTHHSQFHHLQQSHQFQLKCALKQPQP